MSSKKTLSGENTISLNEINYNNALHTDWEHKKNLELLYGLLQKYVHQRLDSAHLTSQCWVSLYVAVMWGWWVRMSSPTSTVHLIIIVWVQRLSAFSRGAVTRHTRVGAWVCVLQISGYLSWGAWTMHCSMVPEKNNNAKLDMTTQEKSWTTWPWEEFEA